jgi:hypothetical protein
VIAVSDMINRIVKLLKVVDGLNAHDMKAIFPLCEGEIAAAIAAGQIKLVNGWYYAAEGSGEPSPKTVQPGGES